MAYPCYREGELTSSTEEEDQVAREVQEIMQEEEARAEPPSEAQRSDWLRILFGPMN